MHLRHQISPNLDNLDKLNESFPWIPNSKQVRPIPEEINVKIKTFEQINLEWTSFRDYLLYRVFEKEKVFINGKFTVVDNLLSKEDKIFKPNDYPYQTQCGLHWIMWYGVKEQPYSYELINNDIYNAIIEVIKQNKIHYFKPCVLNDEEPKKITIPIEKLDHDSLLDCFDFVWYPNPKFSVPDFYHLQVFWTIKI